MHGTSIRRRAVVPLIGLALAGGLTACDSDSGSDATSSSSSSSDTDVSAELTADYAGTFGTPPTDAPDHESGLSVWAVVCGKVVVGCQAPAEAADEAGDALGWDVTIADGALGVGDGYNVAIRQAVAANADAIMTIGIDCDFAKGGLQAAQDAGVPVILMGGFDCADTPLFSAELVPNEEYPAYGDWLNAWGAAKARWLMDATGGQAKVIDTNMIGAKTGEYAREGFDAELKKCSGCSIVDTIDFPVSDLGGGLAQKFSAALLANPDANSVQTVYDSYILAGNMPQAISSVGRDVTIVGGEGTEPGIEFVKAGQVGAEVAHDYGWWGYALIDTALRVLAGEDPVPQGLGWQTVDQDHGIDTQDGAFATTIDYASAYKAAWGI